MVYPPCAHCDPKLQGVKAAVGGTGGGWSNHLINGIESRVSTSRQGGYQISALLAGVDQKVSAYHPRNQGVKVKVFHGFCRNKVPQESSNPT